jgi:hypothetical protein
LLPRLSSDPAKSKKPKLVVNSVGLSFPPLHVAPSRDREQKPVPQLPQFWADDHLCDCDRLAHGSKG